MSNAIAVRGAEILANSLVLALRELEPALFQHVLDCLRDMPHNERINRIRKLIVPADVPVDGTLKHVVGIRLRFSDPKKLMAALVAD